MHENQPYLTLFHADMNLAFRRSTSSGSPELSLRPSGAEPWPLWCLGCVEGLSSLAPPPTMYWTPLGDTEFMVQAEYSSIREELQPETEKQKESFLHFLLKQLRYDNTLWFSELKPFLSPKKAYELQKCLVLNMKSDFWHEELKH